MKKKTVLMKKITVSYHKQLQLLLKNNQEFKSTRMICHAHKLVSFVVEFLMLGCSAPLDFRLNGSSKFNLPLERVLQVYDDVYEKTHRVEAMLSTEENDAIIEIRITFFSDTNNELMVFFGIVNQNGVQRLDAEIVSMSLESPNSLALDEHNITLITHWGA